MRLLKEIDILHNKMTIILLNILVLPLFFLFLMFFVHFASSSKGLVLGVSDFFLFFIIECFATRDSRRNSWYFL